jgi:hypothetical protein
MRKEALKLSNAKKATTKYVQTEIDAARDYGNISKLYTKLPVGIQVSAPIDRDSQASRNDASTTTGFTKSFILGIHQRISRDINLYFRPIFKICTVQSRFSDIKFSDN